MGRARHGAIFCVQFIDVLLKTVCYVVARRVEEKLAE